MIAKIRYVLALLARREILPCGRCGAPSWETGRPGRDLAIRCVRGHHMPKVTRW